MQFLLRLTERNPDIYLDEMQDQLHSQHRVIMGLSTIWDTLTKLGLSRECVCMLFIPQLLYFDKVCSSQRRPWNAMNVPGHDFCFEIGAETPKQLVFIDESRLDARTTYQLNGWALKGQHAHMPAKFVHGQGYVFLLSM